MGRDSSPPIVIQLDLTPVLSAISTLQAQLRCYFQQLYTLDRHTAKVAIQTLQNTEDIMSQGITAAQALADLQAAEQDTQSQVATLKTTIEDGLTKLESLIANFQGGVPVDQLEAVVAKMRGDSASVASLTTEVTDRIAADTNPPQPPTPPTPTP